MSLPRCSRPPVGLGLLQGYHCPYSRVPVRSPTRHTLSFSEHRGESWVSNYIRSSARSRRSSPGCSATKKKHRSRRMTSFPFLSFSILFCTPDTKHTQNKTCRNVSPCVGDIGDGPLETDFFDVDPERGVQVTLMAHEVVFIPFAFLSLEPRRPASAPYTPPPKRPSSSKREGGPGAYKEVMTGESSAEGGAGAAERSVVVAFVSTSHGHVVSVLQV